MYKKILSLMFSCLLALCSVSALASGLTLRVYTPFADLDSAAQAYMDMLRAWEEETGNLVEDHSGVQDGDRVAEMLAAATAGEADVIVAPLGSGLTYEQVLTAQEMTELCPELGARVMPAMADADGSILMTPQRIFWEGVFVNTDMLEENGLAVPQTFEELLAVCAALSAKDVLPIANAMGDWSEVVLECAALASAPSAEFGQETSLSGAMNALLAMQAVGAFGKDTFEATDADRIVSFAEGKAAMRIDDYAFVEMIPESMQDSVVVIPFPRRAGDEEAGVLAGYADFGLVITRSCAEDEARLEAAVSLAKEMLSGQYAQALVTPAGGALGKSVFEMTQNAKDCSGSLYDVCPDFEGWAAGVLAAMKGI